MPSRPQHRLVSVFVIAIVLCALYVLSYAPFLRLRYGADEPRFVSLGYYAVNLGPPTRPDTGPFYKPVEWLIDETRCKAPLIEWAEMWNVSEQTQGGEMIFYFDM